MPHAFLALLIASSPVTSRPLQPDLYQSSLHTPAGVLLLEAAGLRPPRGPIGRGIGNIVAGSILVVLGLASASGGVAALIGAPTQQNPIPLTVIGWTFTGLGILLGVIGLPILFVGIGNLASGPLGLTVTNNGNLAVTF